MMRIGMDSLQPEAESHRQQRQQAGFAVPLDQQETSVSPQRNTLNGQYGDVARCAGRKAISSH